MSRVTCLGALENSEVLLDSPRTPLFLNNLGQNIRNLRFIQANQRPNLPLAQLAIDHCLAHYLGQAQETQRIAHRTGRLTANALADLLKREVELIAQLEVCRGSLDSVEVLALDIFDKRKLELVLIRQRAHQCRDLLQPRLGSSSVAPLTSHNDIFAFVIRGDDDGLQHTVDTDGLSEFIEQYFVKHPTRLSGVGHDFCKLDLAQVANPVVLVGGWVERFVQQLRRNQRIKPPP